MKMNRPWLLKVTHFSLSLGNAALRCKQFRPADAV
jgi:hypothetical protein